MGWETRAHLLTELGMLVAQQSGDSWGANPGDEVGVKWSAGESYLFDSEGKTIGFPTFWTQGRYRMLRQAWLLLTFLSWSSLAQAESNGLTLWHSYRGAEEDALRQSVERFKEQSPDAEITLLSIPYEVMASKLTTAIPRGHGPDLFIFAHERVRGLTNLVCLNHLSCRALVMSSLARHYPRFVIKIVLWGYHLPSRVSRSFTIRM